MSKKQKIVIKASKISKTYSSSACVNSWAVGLDGCLNLVLLYAKCNTGHSTYLPKYAMPV